MHSEEAEIEDASKIEIDWLVDVKKFGEFRKDNRLVAFYDTSLLT